jgi:hypothetical protein
MDVWPFAIIPCNKGSIAYRVKRYRDRADRLRSIAEEVASKPERDTLLRLANTYEELALKTGRFN